MKITVWSPEGETLAETSADMPYLTVEIDPEAADRASTRTRGIC